MPAALRRRGEREGNFGCMQDYVAGPSNSFLDRFDRAGVVRCLAWLIVRGHAVWQRIEEYGAVCAPARGRRPLTAALHPSKFRGCLAARSTNLTRITWTP